jgi:hypothetical protein
MRRNAGVGGRLVDAESLFSIATRTALPGWLLLIFLPRWKYSTLLAGFLIPLLLGVLYAWLVALHFGSNEGGFESLGDVRLLFSNDFLLLAGWVHYLAFDLFTGGWEVRDSERSGIHHLLVVPCLLLTFLFGPAGLLLYFAVRTAVKRPLLQDIA